MAEEMEKYRIIHAEHSDEAANQVLWSVFNPGPEYQIVREWIGAYCYPDEEMDALLKDLRTAEENGTHPSKIPLEHGLSFMDRLIRAKRVAWVLSDDLTNAGSKNPPTGYGGKSIAFRSLNPSVFLDALESTRESGGYLGVHGGPRMGKTGLCLKTGELALATFPGTEFLTNIPIPSPPHGIVYAEDIAAVLRGMADALEAERRWFWGLEELSLAGLLRARGASGFVQDFQRFCRIMPKLGGGIIVDEHREEDVPSVLAAFIKSKLICVRPGFVLADLPAWKGAIEHVPKPDTPYESGQPAPFYIPEDFPWDGLFRALRYDPYTLTLEETTGETQARRIRAFLEGLEERREAKERPLVKCRFCAYEWEPRTDATPDRCPKCRKSDPIATPEPASITP